MQKKKKKTLDYWLKVSYEDASAKNWTKNGLNHKAKKILFPKTLPRKNQNCPEKEQATN
jgi:hypothetical protein